jgi:hypothetical protein
MAARLRRIKTYAEWMKYDISQRRFADVAGKRSYYVVRLKKAVKG